MAFPPSNKPHRGYGIGCLLLCATILFSCAPMVKEPSVYDYGRITNPEDILKEIEPSAYDILKATAKIEVSNVEGRYSTKAAVLVKKPSSLRIEAIPVIGPINLFICIYNDTLNVFFPQKGEFYTGKATPENLAHAIKYFPAGLGKEDMISIMFGTYPSLRHKNITSLRGTAETESYRLDMIGKDGRKLQSLWIDPAKRRLLGFQVFKADGNVAYTARFEEFKESLNAPALPRKITITSGAKDHARVTIHYSEIQIPRDIEASAFSLPTPPGINPISLDR
jgi:outer membrane lipoprotein-sorting protein